MQSRITSEALGQVIWNSPGVTFTIQEMTKSLTKVREMAEK